MDGCILRSNFHTQFFMTFWDIMTIGEMQFSADISGSLTWEWWNLPQVFPLRPLVRAKLVGAYLMHWGSL